MNDRPNSVWERWPDAWRLAGLVLSSIVLAGVLVLRGTAPTPTPGKATVTVIPTATVAMVSPISPLPKTPIPPSVAVTLAPEGVRAGTPIVLEGSAPPGTRVRVYDGAQVLGEARSDQAGRWRLEVGRTWSAGEHRLRVVGLDEAGKEIGPPASIAMTVPTAPT
ncbi:MAG: hypothetical protein J7M34_14645, partial [Anaerolineae bacterium]|nr:hypothetical protein [Anaerolineae bacterium]